MKLSLAMAGLGSALALIVSGSPVAVAGAPRPIPVVDGWPLIGRVGSPQAVDQRGNIYLGDGLRLFSVGPRGGLRWIVDYMRPAGRPILSGDRLYVDSGESLDAFGTDGSIRWRRQFRDGAQSVVAGPAGGALVYGEPRLGRGRVESIGPAGERRWAANLSGPASWPAVGPDGTVFAIVGEESLVALDGETGAQRWSAPLEGALFRTPAVGPDGGVVVAASMGPFGETTPGLLQAFAPDGSPRWSLQTTGSLSAPTVNAAGTVFVASGRGAVLAVGQDGRIRWEASTGRLRPDAPVLGTDGKVDVLAYRDSPRSPQARLLSLDADTGAVSGTAEFGSGASLVPSAGGRLLLRAEGGLWLLDPGARRARVSRHSARLLDATVRLRARPRDCENRSSRQVCVFPGSVGTTLELRAPRAGRATVQIRRVGSSRLLAMLRPVDVPAGRSRLRLGSYRCLDAESTSCTSPGRYRLAVRFSDGRRRVTVSAGVLRVLPSAGRSL